MNTPPENSNGENGAAALEQARRQEIRDSLRHPPLLNLLWLPLIFFVGIPLLIWLSVAISDAVGVSEGWVLLLLSIAASFLAARKGYSIPLLLEEKRAYEASLDRPGLARLLARAEPWIFMVAGLVHGTLLLGQFVDGAAMGMGGMAFLFGGWYVGVILGLTLSVFTRDHLQDRYGTRLLVDVGVIGSLLMQLP